MSVSTESRKGPACVRRKDSVKDLSLKFERSSVSSTEETNPSLTPRGEKRAGRLTNLVSFFENLSSSSHTRSPSASEKRGTLMRKQSSVDIGASISMFDKPASGLSLSGSDLADGGIQSCEQGRDPVFSPTLKSPQTPTTPGVRPGTVEKAKELLSRFGESRASPTAVTVTPERTAFPFTRSSDSQASTPRMRYEEYMASVSRSSSKKEFSGSRDSPQASTPKGMVAEMRTSFSSLDKTSVQSGERRSRHSSSEAVAVSSGIVGSAKRQLDIAKQASVEGATGEQSGRQLRRRSSSSSDLDAIPGGIASRAKTHYLDETSKSKVTRSVIDVYGRAGPSRAAMTSGLTPVKVN